MKKLLILCCVLVGISTVSIAQRARQTPEQQTASLKTSLALTDDQSAKVMTIYVAQAKSMDSLRTASGDDRQGMMQKMMPMQATTNAKIKAILTPDQAATFQKQLDARAERMKQMMQGGGMGGGGGTPPPKR